jgi:transposase
VSEATVCRVIKRLGHSRKKVGRSEMDEWLRLVWRSTFGKLDGSRLVFVDEMGTHTSLAPLYAYAPRGKRASYKVPRNRGKNTTLLVSIGWEGMGPSMSIEGSTTKEVFEAYIECFLAPVLRSGQVVVMDNLSAHKGERVKKLIEKRGWELLYLPPYSPDLNPIEEAFAKVKALLRKVAARSRGALVEAMGAALDAITAQDAHGFFVGHCGYRAPVQPLCQTL